MYCEVVLYACSRPPSKEWRRFGNNRSSHAKRFVCCALTRLYIIYSTVGRSIASISNLGGIFTSVVYIGYDLPTVLYIILIDLL